MAITYNTLANANIYYASNNHVKSFDWMSFDSGQREGSLNQATRELTMYLGRDLEDPTSDTDIYREDYAIFEQALHLLENTPRTQKSRSKEVKLATNEEKEVVERTGVLVSPQAQRYLRLKRLKMARG